MIFGAIAKLAQWALSLDKGSKGNEDALFEIKVDELTEALYKCGIPNFVAKRNARAFMTLRPDFDLRAAKYRRIKSLLEHHQKEFEDAYFDLAIAQGKVAADNWIEMIREQGIFFARIVSLPTDFDTKYLFG